MMIFTRNGCWFFFQYNRRRDNTIISRKLNKINKRECLTRKLWLPPTEICVIFGLLFVMIIFGVNDINCEPKPPKRLFRIIAGFYAYHPSYVSDKPAPVKTIQFAETNKHLQYGSRGKNGYGDYKYYYYGGNKHGNEYKNNYDQSTEDASYKIQYTNKYKSNYKSNIHGTHPFGNYQFDLVSFTNFFYSYTILARKLAEYYGNKYHYPADLLYWQIIGIMFD